MKSPSIVLRMLIAGLFSLFVQAKQSHALQPLSEFFQAAKNHSFDIREAAATAQQRNEEWKAAIGRLLPSLSASGSYTHNSYDDVRINFPIQDPNTGQMTSAERVILLQNQLSGVFSINVPLLDVSAIQRARAGRSVQQAATLRAQAAELEVRKNIARTYFQYIAAAALVGSADRSINTAEESQKMAETRLAVGTASPLDVERAKADTERARQVKADAELTQTLAGRTLETLTGLSPQGEAAPLVDDLHEESNLDDWGAKVGEVPTVKAAQADVKAAGLNASASWWSLAPTLNGSFNEQVTNASGFAGQVGVWNLGLSLTWRFDLSTLFTARSLNEATGLAKIREERTRRDVQDQIFNAWNQIKTYRVRGQAARAQVKASERALEMAKVRYKAGMATQLEVSQAERDRLSAEANRIQTDADLAYARALLRITTNQPIESYP